ncbi:MAG: hypothetical protein LBV04_09550, partial [Deferribacteraceae bacterium]|nr:hypothetical protein [Deferribacteraceae bacterium]
LAASKANAAQLIEAGDYQAAYTIYAALLWDYPDDDEVNLGIAISARQVDRVYPALMALERLSFKYPRDMQIRRELLVVYLEVNDLESARREAEILRQNDIDISGINILPSPSFLYSGYLALGAVYNTNANAGMESNEILPGLFLQDAEKVASSGTYIQGALNGSYKLGTSWWLVGDVNAYYHYNTASELVSNTDILWLRAAAGGRYAKSRYLADLRFKADMTKQGSETDDQKIMAYGLDGQFTYGLRQNITLTTSLTFDTKDYNKSEARNGLYWSLGESIRILFGSKAADLTLGVRLLQASTDAPVYDYSGWETSARMAFYLGRFELLPSAE